MPHVESDQLSATHAAAAADERNRTGGASVDVGDRRGHGCFLNMPIRINLLAEMQAAEDLRRRDPIKRTIYVGALLIIILLVVFSSLWLKGIMARAELNGLEASLHSRTNDYAQVLEKQRKLKDAKVKLAALQQLATNRFLNG